MDGHATHTLSTAGGVGVRRFGNNTASACSLRVLGGLLRVCFPPMNGNECFNTDALPVFDATIHDGMHVLSRSRSMAINKPSKA